MDIVKKRILDYTEKVERILANDDPETDWEQVISEHLNQIGFFQHERLVHLIVTVTFGLILVMMASLLLTTTEFYIFAGIFAMFVIVAVTLVFYVLHYFLLENKVQRLYEIYDQILQKKKGIIK